MTRAIAIIGAGMAGASAARTLRAAGRRVVVFDKGRGIGGRMATRRLRDGLTVDHGAQYITARDPGFAATITALTDAGAAAAWGEAGWSVGTPAMPEPVRVLLGEVPVTTGCTVAGLTREEARWSLRDAGGQPIAGSFDAVLVTAPAPQARALVGAAGGEGAAFQAALSRVRYAPCWALMLTHDGPPPFAQTYRRDREAPLAWIGRDSTKPGRGGGRETLVVHASPDWSRAHLEEERGTVVNLLLEELRRVLGAACPASDRIGEALAHRWRYAQVEEPVGEPCLWSPGLRLGVAGDGCLGGRVEAAYLSGRALAERVLQDGF